MTLIGRILGRLIAVALSYAIACIVAGLIVAGSYIVQAWFGGPIEIPARRLLVETLFVSGMVASVASVYAFAPAIVAIVVAEVFAFRRAIYYVLCGGLAGAVGFAAFAGNTLPVTGDQVFMTRLGLFAAAGFVAGYVYWFIGGHSAGVLQRPAA